MDKKDLKISQLVLAAQLDGGELVPFAKDNGNGAFLLSQLRAYARDGLVEEADLEIYAKRAETETIVQELADARRAIQSMQVKLNQIPTMPPADGKCYALQNGEWVVVADVTETLLTANDDFDEGSDN